MPIQYFANTYVVMNIVPFQCTYLSGHTDDYYYALLTQPPIPLGVAMRRVAEPPAPPTCAEFVVSFTCIH